MTTLSNLLAHLKALDSGATGSPTPPSDELVILLSATVLCIIVILVPVYLSS